jgi:hypothetical protein
VQKKLAEVIKNRKSAKERIEKEVVRLIPKCEEVDGPMTQQEFLYSSSGGRETPERFNFYKNIGVTDKIFGQMDSLPLGKFIDQYIAEGGTNLTYDALFSAQFVRGAGNVFLETDGAIPTGNILGASELPIALEKASADEERGKIFAGNNPVVPITQRESQNQDTENSEILFTTGEYLLDQWKERQGKGELNNPESRKKFLANLHEDLKKKVEEHLADGNMITELDQRLVRVREEVGQRLGGEEPRAIIKEELDQRLEKYRMEEKKIQYLAEVYENSTVEGLKDRMQLKNEVALKIQEKTVLENALRALVGVGKPQSTKIGEATPGSLGGLQGKIRTNTNPQTAVDQASPGPGTRKDQKGIGSSPAR